MLEASLFDPAGLSVAVAAHDVVINLATHMPPSSVRMFMPGAWRENDRIRREGSANLVNAALGAGVQRLIQESYAPIYDSHGSAWIDEDEPVHPGRYNRTILDAEGAVRRFGEAGGAGSCCASPRSTARTPGSFRTCCGRSPGLGAAAGHPGSYVSAVSHDDAAAAVIAALDLPSGIYNVVDDWPVSHRESPTRSPTRRVSRDRASCRPGRRAGRLRGAPHAIAAHLEPEAARRLRVGAALSQRARRIPGGARRGGRVPSPERYAAPVSYDLVVGCPDAAQLARAARRDRARRLRMLRPDEPTGRPMAGR